MKNNGKVPIFYAPKASLGEHADDEAGLTKREHFAGLIMAKLMKNHNMEKQEIDDCAQSAVEAADALLFWLNPMTTPISESQP